jgi:hypothetical protein
MSKETKYALRHKNTGDILGYSVLSNDEADFCVDASYTLHHTSNKKWYVDEPEHAEYVRRYSTEWYNADYNTPNHDFRAEELSVVKVVIETEEEELEVEIPTFEEYAKFVSRDNKKDFKFYMWEKEKYPELHYNLYSLNKMMEAKKKDDSI